MTFGHRTATGYQIDGEKCICCGSCEVTCATGAIRLDNDSAGYLYRIEFDYCIQCGVCADACPIGAIEEVEVETNLFGWERK